MAGKVGLTVKVRGIEALYRNLDHLQAMPALKDYLVEATDIAYDAAKSRKPAFLPLAKEIQPLAGIVYSNDYRARFIEFGRKAGRKQPPIEALERWSKAGQIENHFLVARAIARRGIKGRFFMRKARNVLRREMPRLADKMAARIERDWSKFSPSTTPAGTVLRLPR